VDELQVGESKPFHYPDESYPAILIRLTEEEYKAFESRCTHLLCPVLYERHKGESELGRIFCPCHEGVFDPESGIPVAGPPPRPLNEISLEMRSDGIYAVGRKV
jgi:Rieske Fe-S protein